MPPDREDVYKDITILQAFTLGRLVLLCAKHGWFMVGRRNRFPNHSSWVFKAFGKWSPQFSHSLFPTMPFYSKLRYNSQEIPSRSCLPRQDHFPLGCQTSRWQKLKWVPVIQGQYLSTHPKGDFSLARKWELTLPTVARVTENSHRHQLPGYLRTHSATSCPGELKVTGIKTVTWLHWFSPLDF